MQPTIQVDATKAFAKFSDAGIPQAVRNNLRAVLPQLGQQVGAGAEHRLDSGLKSRTTITINKQMVENPSQISVRIFATSPTANGLLPSYLESGTRPHPITGNPWLAFFWDKIGQFVALPRVNHPGFAGIHYMQNTMAEQEPNIVNTVSEAVKRGLNQ